MMKQVRESFSNKLGNKASRTVVKVFGFFNPNTDAISQNKTNIIIQCFNPYQG